MCIYVHIYMYLYVYIYTELYISIYMVFCALLDVFAACGASSGGSVVGHGSWTTCAYENTARKLLC